MIEVIFLVIAIVYLIIALKVKAWSTISSLGFKSETPMLFLKHSMVYYFIEWLFFFLVLISVFNFSNISRTVGFVALAVLWFLAWFLGQKKGFAKYREVLQEMILSADTDEKKEEYRKELQKTDVELRELAQSLSTLRF